MNKLVLTLCLSVLAISAVSQDKIEQNQTEQKQPEKKLTPEQVAIIKVFRERYSRHLANSQIVIDYGRIKSIRRHEATYVRSIKQIDTEACPKSFRLAWFDYITALEAKQQAESNIALDVVLAAATGHVGSLASVIHQLEPQHGIGPYRALERAALDNDVDAAKIRY